MKHLYLSLLGIGMAASTAFAQYNATITVTDLVTGLPLQNAEVIFDGNFQTTDAAGMAVFPDLIDFDYSYTVTKACYEANSGMLTIAGADNSAAIALEPTTSNNVFFFVGSPLTIPNATVTLTDGANYNETLVTGAPFGDLFENVPFGEYSYSISIPCYEPLSGNVTVDCPESGDGVAVFAEPVALTANNVFFFVGSPLTIPNATVTLTDGANYNETLVTGAPFGDLFENVPFGEYSYSISIPCYEPLSGNVTVNCPESGDGIAVFAEPVALTANNVFFFVGSPLTIPNATVTLTDGANYNETLVTGAPFGDLFENVPFGEYSYSISIPCYEPLSGNVMVDCPESGDGIAVFAEPVALTANNVFFFVGSPLTIPGATVTLTDNANYLETLVTGAPFGDLFENVPFGEYSYSISIPCYEPLSGNVTVDCPESGDGIAVFAEPVALTANNVFFFVGSPLTIPGATVTLTDNANYLETLVTGAPFGDLFENVPFGEYSYSISIPCYEPLSGNVMVDCPESGDGIAVFAEPVEVAIDVTVTIVGSTLTATTTGVDYQWVDCDNNNTPIAGEDGQSFTATQNGNYGVIITSGGCSRPSECTAVVVSGVNDLASADAFTVFPNPFADMLMIRTNTAVGPLRVELFNVTGQLVIDKTKNGVELITVNTIDLTPGSYIMRLTSGSTRTTMRVVK